MSSLDQIVELARKQREGNYGTQSDAMAALDLVEQVATFLRKQGACAFCSAKDMPSNPLLDAHSGNSICVLCAEEAGALAYAWKHNLVQRPRQEPQS